MLDSFDSVRLILTTIKTVEGNSKPLATLGYKLRKTSIHKNHLRNQKYALFLRREQINFKLLAEFDTACSIEKAKSLRSDIIFILNSI